MKSFLNHGSLGFAADSLGGVVNGFVIWTLGQLGITYPSARRPESPLREGYVKIQP
jgi:hypothetical protein